MHRRHRSAGFYSLRFSLLLTDLSMIGEMLWGANGTRALGVRHWLASLFKKWMEALRIISRLRNRCRAMQIPAFRLRSVFLSGVNSLLAIWKNYQLGSTWLSITPHCVGLKETLILRYSNYSKLRYKNPLHWTPYSNQSSDFPCQKYPVKNKTNNAASSISADMYVRTCRTLAFHIDYYASLYWYLVAIITGLGKKSIVLSWPPLYLCRVVIMNQRPSVVRILMWHAPLRMDPGKTNDPTPPRNLTSGLWRYNWPLILKLCRCSSIASPSSAFRYSCLA